MNRFSIDLKSGLSYSNPFISKFNNAFDEIEFIVAKSDEFEDCTFSVVYNVLGNCGMDIEGGGKLSRSTSDENVSLFWTLGNTVSLESGIVLYQVVAYKSDESGGTIAVWYSPQGRIIVGESIDTTEYETLQIGSQPSLIAQILSLVTDVKSDVSDVDVQIKDAMQSILVFESEVADFAGEISEIKKDVEEVFGKAEEISNDIETHNTEINSQISDIRQFRTNTQKQMSELQTDLETKVDKVSGKQLSTEDYTTKEKNLVAQLDKQMGDLLGDVAQNTTDIRNLYGQDFVSQGYVNEKISQIEESIGSVDQAYNPDSQNAQSGIAVAEGIGDVDEALREVVELQNKFIDGNYVVADQTYDPTSKNAQSGIAVAEGIASIDVSGEWTKIGEVTLGGTFEKISSYSDGVITFESFVPTIGENYVISNQNGTDNFIQCKFVETDNEGEYTLTDLDKKVIKPMIDVTNQYVQNPDAKILSILNQTKYGRYKIRVSTPRLLTFGARMTYQFGNCSDFNPSTNLSYAASNYMVIYEAYSYKTTDGKSCIKKEITSSKPHTNNEVVCSNVDMFSIGNWSLHHYSSLMTIGTHFELWGSNL